MVQGAMSRRLCSILPIGGLCLSVLLMVTSRHTGSGYTLAHLADPQSAGSSSCTVAALMPQCTMQSACSAASESPIAPARRLIAASLASCKSPKGYEFPACRAARVGSC